MKISKVMLLAGLLALAASTETHTETEAMAEPHKTLFPMTTLETFGVGVVFAMSMLSNAGGVGGGAVLVPITMLFFDFGIKEAVPISTALVFISALVRFIGNMPERHPKNNNKTVVDYELVNLAVPALFVGSLAGVVIVSTLPDMFVLVMLCLVLLYAGIMTFRLGLKMYRQETIT